MQTECQIVEQPARPTLYVRRQVAVQNMPQTLGQAWGAIMQYLGELGEQPAGAPYVAYHNMDMQNLDIEAAFPVARPLPGRGDVQAGELPAGRYATCVHAGPYNELGMTYEALTKYMAEQGQQPVGVAYEVYLNDPQTTPPQDLQTQVLFSLKS
ncbi:MAG: GyrI-like domain-containing protein [Chloroflexota bacterium]